MAQSLVPTAPTSATPPRDRLLWTLRDAEAAGAYIYPATQNTTAKAGADSIASYVQGEHYQEAKPWMGAGYSEDGATLSEYSRARINRMLTPVPEAFPCIERRVDGACGNQAKIDLVARDPQGETDKETGVRQPSEEQQRATAKWLTQFSAFWDRVSLWGGKDLRKPTGVRGAVAQASWHASGSACVRIYYNPASRTQEVAVRGENGAVVGTELRIPKQPDRAAAFEHIEVVAPPPERCFVYVDPDTHRKTGVFIYTDTAGAKRAEIWYADGAETVLRVLTDAAQQDEPKRYPWGGLLPIVQADIGTIFTDAVRRTQGSLDAAATSLFNNIIQHGYSQRTETNAEADGYWSDQRPGDVAVPRERVNDDTGAKEYFTPTSPELSGSSIRRLVGFRYSAGESQAGPAYGFTNPAVTYHEPSDTASLIAGVDALIMIIRGACHQAHIRAGLLGSAAELSGEAYEQARAAFLADIKGVGEAVDALLAPVATVATVMADWLAGVDAPVFAEQYAVQVQSHPDAGAPSADFQRVTREMVDGELLSPEEGTARLGVQDVAAERAKIAAASSLTARAAFWTAVAAAVSAGFDREAVLLDMGYTPERAAPLVRSDGPPNIQQ